MSLKKNPVFIAIAICLLYFTITARNNIVHAQIGKTAAFKGEFDSRVATDRIVIKLNSELDRSEIKIKNGTVETGIKSIDFLNTAYNVTSLTPLFPGSENSMQASDMGLQKIYRIHFPATQNISEIVRAYTDNPEVEFAQPVGIHQTVGTTPNDSYFNQQWNMPKIQCPEAWGISQGDSTVLLAIVDTGVDWAHPDLGGSSPFLDGNIWTNWAEYTGTTGVDDDGNGYIDDIRGWDWVTIGANSSPTPSAGEDVTDEDNNPMDFNGHGTHCAGIASALTNNAVGVAGLAWGCKVMPLRVGWSCSYMGYEVGLVAMDYCAQAIYYAAQNNASAINCSWGSSNTGGIGAAVDFATGKGVVVVSAAGNDDLPNSSYLASRYDCFAVAATGPDDIKASYSSFGFWVDISAPGGDSPPDNHKIYSTYFDHNSNTHTYEWANGTSMAAPHIVGLTGLVKTQFPGLGWRALKERLQYTSDDLDGLNPDFKNGLLGEGRINAFSAVSQAAIPSMSTIFSENFDSGLPASWTADAYWYDNDPGNRNTEFDDQYESGSIKVGYEIWTPPFMIVDSDFAGSVNIDASLISPIIDCSLCSDIRLVFDNWFQNYRGSNAEKGDIDIKIDGGSWQNIAAFTSNTSYNIVDAGREIVVRLPAGADFKSSVQLRWHYYNANYEWFWGIDNVKLVGEMIMQDYYVQLSPSSQSAGAEPGDTLTYFATVKNIGLQSDSYDLSAAGNSWPTTIWNSDGTGQISNTGSLASTEESDIVIKVEIPNNAVLGDVDVAKISAASTGDPAVFAEATIQSSVNVRGRIPWFEDFASATLDTMIWPVNTGPAEVTELGINEPSSPYSLNLNGAETSGDEIQTETIDLSNETGVILSYYYQRTGGGDSPESGDDLWVDYLNVAGTWINLKHYLGSGSDMNNFSLEPYIVLPNDAYHSDFQLRFRNAASSGNYDDWFIDDISLAPPPEITVAPDSFSVTLDLGDSTSQTLIIGNVGRGTLEFKLSDHDVLANSANSFAGVDGAYFSITNSDYDQQILLLDAIQAMNNRKSSPAIGEIDEDTRLSKNPNRLNSTQLPHEAVSLKYAITATSTLNVALLAADYASYSVDVQNTLLATGKFASVTSIDATSVTPTLSELQAFDAVLVWSNLSFQNSTILGDNLADYVDSGGGVVLALHAISSSNTARHPRGRFHADDYYAVAVVDVTSGSRGFLGNIYEPNHPVMNGVTSFDGGSYSFKPTGGLAADAVRIADWDDGKILVATKIINGHRRADLGFRPMTTNASEYGWEPSTDGGFLLANALEWATGAGVQDWLSYNPVSGNVIPNTNTNIELKIHAVDLIPNTTYLKNLIITSNDPITPQKPIPVRLTVNSVAYYVIVTPEEQRLAYFPGDTAFYKIIIENRGLNDDTYILGSFSNSWPTTIWDSTGTNEMSGTGTVTSESKMTIAVRVEIPTIAVAGDVDTARVTVTSNADPAVSDFAIVITTAGQPPGTIPWYDNFPVTALDTSKWTITSGTPSINAQGQNEPSAPYSLELKGGSGGDKVESKAIDLSGQSRVVLSYYCQNNSTESGDDLVVKYFDGTSWSEIARHPGAGDEPSYYVPNQVLLPSGAYHREFQFMFHSEASVSGDEWFVDNVKVALAPDIGIAPDNLSAELAVDDSTTQILTIKNTGGDTLTFTIATSSALQASVATNISDSPALQPAYKNYPGLAQAESESDNIFEPLPNNAVSPDNLTAEDKALPKQEKENEKNEHHSPLAVFDTLPVVHTIPVPYNGRSRGIAWDGAYLWTNTGNSAEIDFIFKIDPNTGAVLEQHIAPGTTSNFPIALEWDNITPGGPYLWSSDQGTAQISMLRPGDMSVVRSFAAPGIYPYGLARYGDLLWNIESNTDAFYKLDAATGNVISSFPAALDYFSGLEWDGAHLWASKRDYSGTADFLYKIDPATGTTLEIYDAPGEYPNDLAWDENSAGGPFLWVLDWSTNLIYKLKAPGKPATWLSPDPLCGKVAPGESMDIAVTFNSTGLTSGTTYTADILIKSNDPDESTVTVPALLTVTGGVTITGTVDTSGVAFEGAVVQLWKNYPEGSIIISATSGSDGTFSLKTPAGGTYDLRAFASGFFPVISEDIIAPASGIKLTLLPVPAIVASNEWVSFYSSNTSFGYAPVQAGDVVIAKDPDGVICGASQVHTVGNYGLMSVYRDDAATVGIDEGANPGELIGFEINGDYAEALGPDDPIWTNQGAILKVDLAAYHVISLEIPMIKGWNLVSWNVDTPCDSTPILLKNIMDNVVVVLGYENGGLTYKPDLAQFSTLNIMDHLHGYWIMLSRQDTLSLIGTPVDPSVTPIHCEPGWNLVSYLPGKPDSIAHAFGSIMDNLIVALGFDNGGLTYDPTLPQFSSLQILRPTFGYWLKLTQEDTLIYPMPLPDVYTNFAAGRIAANDQSLGNPAENVIPTNKWINLYGQAVMLDEQLLPKGTIVKANDSDGIICGEYTVETAGCFGLMAVYGDDASTEVDEGAAPGSELSIHFGEFELPIKVTWTKMGDVINIGEIILSSVDELRTAPKCFALDQNYPNPFNPNTSIKYQLASDCHVTLKIYNTLGQAVAVMVDKQQKAGFYTMQWDAAGQASGVYFIRIQADNYIKMRKMILLR